jgi:hypothetical protein
MANPRLDRKDPKSIGSIHPPLKVEGGMAVYEQNHHYFDVHGKYLSSHEGYEPGRDVGAAADAVIENVRGMSDEAKMKIARELGFAPAPAKAPSRRKPIAMPETAVTQDPDLPGDEDEGETEGDENPAGLLPRGPLQPPVDPALIPRIGGLDLVGWAQKSVQYPSFQVKKAWNEAFPGRPAADQKAVLAGMVAEGLIDESEIKLGR